MNMQNLQKMSGMDMETTDDEPKDYSKLYDAISVEIGNHICNNVYTDTEEKTNIKGNINKMLIKVIQETFENPEYKEKIFDIIFEEEGNEKKKKGESKGLRKYIENLFKISAGHDREQIYAFTGRILQRLFNINNKTIDEVYDDTNSSMNDSQDVIVQKMKEEIMNKLKTPNIKKGGAAGDWWNPFQQTEEKKEKKEEEKEEKELDLNEEQIEQICNPKKEEYELTKFDANPSKETTEMIKEIANTVQNSIFDHIQGTDSVKEKVETSIITALGKIIGSIKSDIYKTITQDISNKITSKFTDDKTIELQILYSILSYEIPDRREKMEDNTLYIAKKMFMQAIEEKKNGAKESLVKILHSFIEDAIKKKDSGVPGVEAFNSLMNTSIQGGKIKRRTKRTKKIKKTKRRKSIRKSICK